MLIPYKIINWRYITIYGINTGSIYANFWYTSYTFKGNRILPGRSHWSDWHRLRRIIISVIHILLISGSYDGCCILVRYRIIGVRYRIFGVRYRILKVTYCIAGREITFMASWLHSRMRFMSEYRRFDWAFRFRGGLRGRSRSCWLAPLDSVRGGAVCGPRGSVRLGRRGITTTTNRNSSRTSERGRWDGSNRTWLRVGSLWWVECGGNWRLTDWSADSWMRVWYSGGGEFGRRRSSRRGRSGRWSFLYRRYLKYEGVRSKITKKSYRWNGTLYVYSSCKCFKANAALFYNFDLFRVTIKQLN